MKTDKKNSNKRKHEERKFKVLTEKEIKCAFDYQKKIHIWDFYSEREFIETLFTTRFNYFLVVYSLFVTAFASIDGKTNKLIVLYTGVILLVLIGLTIYRVYVKLDINFRILYSLDEKSVFPVIAKETKAQGIQGLFGVNPIYGIIIPILSIISFIVAIFLIAKDYWNFLPPQVQCAV